MARAASATIRAMRRTAPRRAGHGESSGWPVSPGRGTGWAAVLGVVVVVLTAATALVDKRASLRWLGRATSRHGGKAGPGMQLLRHFSQLGSWLVRFSPRRGAQPKQLEREGDLASSERTVPEESLQGESLTKAEALMLEEYHQVWEHARHMETMRSQYLGFFFTVTLGLAVLAVPTISAGALNNPARLVVLSGFLTVFFLFTAFIYIAIRKTGVVYGRYVGAIHLIRDHFLVNRRGLETVLSWLRFLESDIPIMRSRLFRIQTTAEFIIRLFMLLTVFAAGLISIRLISIKATAWQVGLATIVVGLILVGTTLLIFGSKGKRRRP
jgi:heme/copper-type cytochrome/quinol oxidase subunit 4